MTDPTRSPRYRRAGRRPGWMLLTALLVLAIAASSALVFTDRVELLKLAVILALWAAVVAAFVSVIYRRQSDVDQARVRDLKLVYDLQLDREISARREYELSLESQLRRELEAEVRARAADEMATLRAELAALRANLEILFDADLSHRPAIEPERTTVRAYSDWARDSETTGRVSSSRIDDYQPDIGERTTDSSIIDVPAEPQPPEFDWHQTAERVGSHRRASDADWGRQPAQEPTSWAPPPPPAEPVAQTSAAPPPPPQPVPEPSPTSEWQPAPADGHWLPPGAPGSHWASTVNGSTTEYVGRRRAPERGEDLARPAVAPDISTPSPEPRRGRHSAPPDGGDPARPAQEPVSAEPPEPSPAPPPTARRRRRSADDADTAGQSVAELLARLQASPTPGGRRRRREE
ncbi:hypothetical protein AU193_06090 [Mycobacterium sp. GA-1285]|uniref:DUF6779 domain-containing protein n=1 Tax=Mycobacterium sp. GA-1285 TaxID=1772282 RepID=UPI0007488ADB|nr:DUF6779 domain-containing protein [Mycobacterium sp. GA-1285]KUI21912.1 hypothetical protein AU193_06090 [Mycobacterium sp. GA-1285]